MSGSGTVAGSLPSTKTRDFTVTYRMISGQSLA